MLSLKQEILLDKLYSDLAIEKVRLEVQKKQAVQLQATHTSYGSEDVIKEIERQINEIKPQK